MSQTRLANGCVAGTGIMGAGIALTLALGGVRTFLLSRSGERAERGVARARKSGTAIVEEELLDRDRVESSMKRITGCADFESAIGVADICCPPAQSRASW